MKLFSAFTLRPFMRIANALEGIEKALEYFAIQDAKRNNAMFFAGRVKQYAGDESELLHTDDRITRQRQQEEFLQFLQSGYPALDAQDEIDM